MTDSIGGENLADNISELSSFSDSSDEGRKVEEVVTIAEEETDKPAYSEDDLDTLVGFMRNMIYLFDYDSSDFNDEVSEMIKLWLIDVNYPLLFIYYDGDVLAASLTFPKCVFNDLMYFMREPDQLFNILERFYDDLMFGTLHSDIEGSLLITLEQVYGPLMLSNTEWSENVKAHVLSAYNTFMSFLTDIHYKLSGFTLLYVPREGSDMEIQEVVLNRTTIKRLEAVVIEWTSQIRSTINDIQHSVPNDLICPSDEYNFWIYRYEILSAVQSQFKNTNIQHIIKILDLAQSLYTKPLREVLNDLMKEIEIAESNIPFLKLLVDPCFAIRSLDNEHDLCSQLIYVMHIIRFIGEDSSHLRQDECITKLFLYLSNEIVSCCMQSIDIDKILSGSPIYGIEVCNVKINCCESFKIIYEEMVEHFRNNYGWKLDYAIIFNRIDAFVQRLHDTLEICSAMKIFGKYSGSNAYKNYKFSCNNAEMFEEKCCQVGAIFTKGIEEIQTVSGSILDINSKEWYTCIAKFREMLKNLDDIIENLLSNVFLVADNIEEKINVLTTLLNFFKRDSIRESFMRKISEIWKAFKAEITSLSKTVSSGINWYSTLFPRKSGQYTLLKIRFERIYRLKDLLERCRFFPQFSESDDILTLFESCENQVKTALKSYNDLWIRSLNADIGSWYQRHLICRSQIRPGLLECHIERRMLVVFDEAYFFKVLQATVPSIMDMDKNDNVKLTFDNVIRIILYFNNVISSISDKERLFFKPMIQQTERKLEPLRGKFTWEEDLGEFIDTFVHNVKDLLDVIQVYKKENIKIANWMENIYNMLLFKLDHEKAQLLVDFTIGIKNKKHASIMELVQVYSEISKHIFCIFEALGSNIRKMGESWALYVQKIDRLLQAAIFNSSLNTLENIQQALQKESSPILSIELILNKAGILFQPSLESIELSLKRLPSEVTSIMKIIPNMCQRFQIDSDCSFYDDFLQYNKFKNIESNIYKDINETMKELHVFREKWNVFRPFWSINRKSFIDKFKLASMTAQAFQRNNEKFEELLNQLTTQKDSTVCKCVDVDALKLKFAITSHINDWQFKYIEYLKCVAYGRIIDFHNTLNNNMKSLSVEPKEVEDLKILEKTYQKCVENLAPFEEEIHIIIEYFNVLEKCVLDILPEAYNLRRNIHPNWQQYIDYLTQIKEQIENYQNQFKLSMANDVAELKVNALEMLKMLENEMPVDDDISPLEAFSKIDLLMKQLEVLEKKENNIREKLKLLGIDYYPLDVISEIRRKLENMNLIWKLVEQWKTMKCQINNIRYSTMEVEETTENITFITSELQNLNKSLQRDEEYPIFQSIKTDINNVHVTFLIFVDMSLSHMRPRHWSDIQLIIDFKFETFELISIEEAMKHKLFCYKQALTQLCLIARKEFTIEEELEKVENVAKTIKYNIQQASNATYSILESEKVFSLLKSNLTIIDQLRQSPYRKHFQENINHWEQNLHFMSDFLELLTLMERQSDTLYEVFNITKFSTNLVDFNETFKMCFDKWTDLLKFLQKTNLQYDICPHAASFTKDTESLRKRFDEMAISLKRMLHHQRSNCNRLFLVPDELLIQMIGFPNDLDTIQASFMYTYENIKKLNIKQIEAPQKYEKRWEIYGIQTNERENVEFNKTIVMDSEQNITTILNQIEISVFETINIALLKCYEYLKQNYFKRLESGWISRWMHQTIIKSTQMENTMHIRNAIVQTNLLGKFKPLKMLRIMHSKMLQGLLTSKQNGMNLNYSVFLRRKLEDLSIVEINTRDVIESLIKAKVSSLSAFEWICQIKSYWNDETKKCSVAQLNSMFAYGYELKECGKPMFITPQSNRMMMTITNIIKNRFIPYVNENSIDHGYRLLNQLAIEIATLFVTLSCNTSWMITDVTRIIDGVKNLQAWICFRNIDKLSSQIQSAINGVIREALVENPKQATLNLKHSKITNHFHIFAIVNDYSYQSPAIDRSIMRPISITLPDRIIVFENLLYLCGFKQYKKLSSLLKLFYECILGSIPSQAHIWTLNRMEQAIFKSTETIRNEQYQEAHVIGYAMEDEFISSLPEKEKDCFTNYVETIFFNGSRLTGDSESDNKSLQKAFQSMNLKHSDISEKRVKQIVQAVRNHRQLIITGAVCSGKSSLINLAIQTLSEQGEHFRKYYVHPMTLNTKTHNNVLDNTIEAILTTIMQSNTHKKKCIILDGPLNDSWLEHIVFDRRQIRSDMLTVSYGVNDVKLIIETVDLHHATPAHISFFPVIHVNSIDLTWRQIIYAWIESEKWADSMKDELQMLVDKYLEIFLNFRHQQCSVNEEQTDVAILYTLCALFDNIFSKWNIENTTGVEKHTEEAITKLFIFCCIWSIGGSLREKERLKLDVFIREQVSETSACFPLKGNVFQYNVSIVNTTSIWELWNIDRIECSSEFVFTLDNRPYHYILSMLMNDKRSVLLTSETTVGKSTLIGNFIKTTHKTKSKICISNLTGKTSINSLRQLLMQHSMNISKNIVYPKERKNLTWFIDDIHNISDSRVEICEFLRRLMEHHSWHENSRSQCIRQTNIVAAMLNSKKLSKHETSFKQLLNKFHIIFYDKSDDENTAIIFKKRVECLTSDELIVKILAAIPSATVDFVRKLSTRFPASPIKPRYEFSLKNISRIIDKFCILKQKSEINNSNNCLRLWIHECFRETYDVLDRTDYNMFYDTFNDTISKYFDFSLHGICPGNRSPIFCDVMNKNATYQDITEISSLKHYMENNLSCTSKLTIYCEAVQHVSKVLRILKTGDSHIVLAGHIGSGRETICQIAAQVSNNTTFKILDIPRDAEKEIVDINIRDLLDCSKKGRTLCVVKIDRLEDINSHILDVINSIIVNQALFGYYPCSNNSRNVVDESAWAQIRENLHFSLLLPTSQYQYCGWQILIQFCIKPFVGLFI
ncbi:dynein axonemal heavy chain 2-like isoform X3 [Armigeres subalbatus]|uniref:dynein axonemal heavy chain 2-like isoform X3 n=1 Tax=Armigeres subalbatus TaxID=124917 RepID=UPI002ED4D7EE